MKKLLLLTMVAGFLTTAAFSQNFSTTPAESKQDPKKAAATEWEKKIKDELKLSTDQITKWEVLNKEYKEKIDAVMNASDLTKEAQKEKKMELKKEKEAQFIQLLTPEQQSKYKEILEQKKKDKEAGVVKPSGS